MLTAKLTVVLLVIPMCWCLIREARGPCSGGVFATLWREAYSFCYDVLDTSVEKLQVTKSSVSGQDILRIYSDFCREQGSIKLCLLGKIGSTECLAGSESYLDELLAQSATICDGIDVKNELLLKIGQLPRVSLVSEESECYRNAYQSIYNCTEPEPNSDKSFHEMLNDMLRDLSCAVRGLESMCSHDEAVLYEIMEEFLNVCPPALGVDVLDTLVNL